MKKDYAEWHSRKTEIEHLGETRLFFHEREVWWCSIGHNVGFEQDGKGEKFARPVLVFKKFNKEVFWALPISTRIKKSKFYTPINIDYHSGISCQAACPHKIFLKINTKRKGVR